MFFLRFLKANFIYLIWFAVYFTFAWWIFGANWNSALIVGLIYACSIGVALSPVGEVLLRLSQGCNPPATKQESEYLLPLFEEVYESAKERFPSINKGIKIYITDDMFVNAFAIGRKTISVTRGAIETLSREELKGVLAHELGHMLHGHTKALLITLIGNFVFTAIVFALNILIYLVRCASRLATNFTLWGWLCVFTSFLFNLMFQIFVLVFVNFGQIILSDNSKANEFQADKFAHEIGFGSNLIKALYLLQKMSVHRKIRLSERMKASHPHLAIRIKHLEALEEKVLG